jgi:ubiquinone/menaquinone biosynthesis C-methylase UbiE
MTDNYRIWDKDQAYGDVFFERAIGKREEMESAKALCTILTPLYKQKMKVLDVGCGVGHYLRSLRTRLDENIDYTGTDITQSYIERAKKAFPNTPFYVEDIHNLSFKDNTYDIVTCNNVLLHLPPPPKKAISELLRVSKNYVVLRLPIGTRNYIIKEIRSTHDTIETKQQPKEADLIDKNGEPRFWNYFNLYTTSYIQALINECAKNAKVQIIDDTFWKEFKDVADSKTVTKIIDGKQVSGNIILDWKFFIIKKM